MRDDHRVFLRLEGLPGGTAVSSAIKTRVASNSVASAAQRFAMSVRLSFKFGLLVCDAKAKHRLARSRHSLGSPGM
jgi:hypothetical protein